MKILGIDPGSRLTGFGVIETRGTQIIAHDAGVFRLLKQSVQTPLEIRLSRLHQELEVLIQRHRPDALVVEKVFFAKNAMSALKLGHARGVVVLAAGIHSIPLVEYSPTEIKQVVTGHGRSDKESVAKMVRMICGVEEFATHDASDALAVAICHGLMSRGCGAVLSKPASRKKSYSIAESVGISKRK